MKVAAQTRACVARAELYLPVLSARSNGTGRNCSARATHLPETPPMLIRKSAGDRIYIEDLNDHDAALRRLARPSGASSGPGGLGVPSGGRSRVFKGPAIIALAWNIDCCDL